MAGEGDAERLVVLLVAQIRDFEKQMQKASDTAGRNFKRTRDDSKKASKAVEDDWNKTSGNVARALAALGGPLGSTAGRFAAFSEAGSKTGLAMGAAAVGISVAAAAATKAVVAYAQLEAAQVRLANVIRTSGSGQSAGAIQAQARLLGLAGTQSLQDIRAASTELARYRDISRSAFGEALRLSQDLSANGFVNLSQAATAFGRALSNPIEGLQALRDAGVRFSPVQEKLIDDLFKSGRAFEAQVAILKIAADQLGGNNARAADTLGSAYGRLTNASTSLVEVWGRDIAKALDLKTVLDQIATGMDRVSEKARTGSSLASFLTAASGVVGALTPGGPGVASLIAPYMRAGADHAGADRKETPFESNLDYYSRLYPGQFKPQAAPQPAEPLRIDVRPSGLTEAQSSAVQATNLALEQQTKLIQMNAVQRAQWEAKSKALIASEGEVSSAVREAAAGIDRRVNAMMAAGAVKSFTDSTRAATDSLRLEAQTFGMSEGAAAAYRREQELLADTKRAGIALSPSQVAAVHAEASAYGQAAQQVTNLRDITSSFQGFGSEFRQQLMQGANAWTAFGNAALSALGRIADKLLDRAFMSAFSSILSPTAATAGGGSFFSAFGLYDTGGYTGPGSKKQPAGIVHRGEVVWSQDDVRRAGGVGVVEGMRRGLRGYDSGGPVGSAPSIRPTIKVQSTVNNYAPVNVQQQQSTDGMSIETVITPLDQAQAARIQRGAGPSAKVIQARMNNRHLLGA
jgi:hypothetical protein